jgi:hypothetical protein
VSQPPFSRERSSGVAYSEFRWQKNGGAWTDWIDAAVPRFTLVEAAAGDVITADIREVDAVGNISQTASSSITLAALAGDEPAENSDSSTPEDALVRDWGVSQAEAATRIGRQDAIAAMEDQLATSFPGSFAGLWVDQADGGKIKVATTVPGITSGVAGENGLAPDLVVEMPAAHNLEELQSIAEDLANRFGAVPADRQPDSGVDVEANTVSITIHDPNDPDVAQILDGIRSDYGSVITTSVDSTPVRLIDCARHKCLPPDRFRAGLEIVSGVGRFCTSGFTATDATGNNYVLTAGHCAGATWYHSGRVLGDLVLSVEGSRGDVEAIRVRSTPDWNPAALIYRLATDKGLTISSIAHRISKNTYLCNVGPNAGNHCGMVLYANRTFRGTRGLVETASCAAPGDSGGPVWRDHTAYGTLVAANGCRTAEAQLLGTVTFFEPIATAESLLDLHVSLAGG